MSRIGGMVTGIEQFLLTQLTRLNQAAITSTVRLSTGKYVNTPKDDPSAYLQIHNFEKQLSHVSTIKANVEAAATIGAEAQLLMDEIRTQLTTIRDKLKLDENNTLTQAERDANQIIINTAIDKIRSLARTPVAGKRFLDGSYGYTLSSLNLNQIRKIDVYSLADDFTVSGVVGAAATRASVNYTGLLGNINGSATFNMRGLRGSSSFTVTNGEALTAVRDRVNKVSHNTGISASVSGSILTFTSVDYGANAEIDIDVTSGTFTTAGTTVGTDAVVTINGRAMLPNEVDGNRVSFHDHGVHLAIELTPGYVGALSSVTISDDQVARFKLSTAIYDPAKLGLPSVFPELLGGVSGMLGDIYSGGAYAGLGTNTSTAIRIVDEATAQLGPIDGMIDGFADITVAAASRLMTDFEDQLNTTLDTLNGVDKNAESLVLAKYQSLAANTVAAMSILQQQQSFILSIFRQQAGFG